jgi:hypothetical protein
MIQIRPCEPCEPWDHLCRDLRAASHVAELSWRRVGRCVKRLAAQRSAGSGGQCYGLRIIAHYYRRPDETRNT